ncbi:flagellar export chaperone FliS [Bacillus salitolerans]|uniref:Flagellar secretion chaperone FliS n=1 Tax=Bacillus salitolerans TaxID=1437434 RepID=A0ABW4LNK9_9BACI
MAINKHPHQAYQQNAITTATPEQLTLMLYNGCLKFMKLARQGIEQQNIEVKNVNLQKAQNIIHEFMVTLNTEIEISQNLLQLYDYIYRRLIEVNIKNDLTILEEVEGYVVELRDTWKEAMLLSKQAQPVQGGQA